MSNYGDTDYHSTAMETIQLLKLAETGAIIPAGSNCTVECIQISGKNLCYHPIDYDSCTIEGKTKKKFHYY